ncbi:sulfatase-like hydrolase/transferase [Paracoccus sp. MC1854]|uniref:sulfatase-like hydrolase/transferase n=1 Tax=Paracoccus sp. MC1854 TaxID=2760306 RepID=UPI001603DC0E|nr:sulfatase-like hydrolase/transferase [Paracoccus sp. MC1854]MBB1492466.1 sulfatase-like hydrolase/transferase [Paracoccus sp. MC1854]
MSDTRKPNLLILVEDQWQAHMPVPDDLPLPAWRRLHREGVAFNRAYCTVPICTPSRATMWTGQHAKKIDMWDNTNYAWLTKGMDPDIPTLGDMLRGQGYYTAFKGKWHLSRLDRKPHPLEDFGWSDTQEWGDMFGGPLQGAQLDTSVAEEAVDWLEHRAPTLDQPWALVVSLINPHDVMFVVPDKGIGGLDAGFASASQHPIQQSPFFQKEWDVAMPNNHAYEPDKHPPGVAAYYEYLRIHFGHIPEDRTDLWLKQRNYLLNCMRLVDMQFDKVLQAMDRVSGWDDTVVIYTGDHGEMNGAHNMTQKGGITFDEAQVVPLIIRDPQGRRGARTEAIGSLLDLVPTCLDYAGVPEERLRADYPDLPGRSLRPLTTAPESAGPRGSAEQPVSGALTTWDTLHALDNDWALTGALAQLTDLQGGVMTPDEWLARIPEVGAEYGAPDFGKRNFHRSLTDGCWKIVRWFSPDEYGNPASVEELRACSDVGLYDLINDPGETESVADPAHPRHDAQALAEMTRKLHELVARELGEDLRPFDPAMFAPADAG